MTDYLSPDDVVVRNFRAADTAEYEELVDRSRSGVFTHSIEYRDLLESVIDAQSHYIIAEIDGEIRGAFPIFIAQNDVYGSIINSLPFFGSHGGLLVDPDIPDEQICLVGRQLLGGVGEAAEKFGCELTTIVCSPFAISEVNSLYDESLGVEYTDVRTAQITEFTESAPSRIGETVPDKTPAERNEATTVEEYLFTILESRCRRAIRKAEKEGLEVFESDDFEPLYEMHIEGMERIDGTVKPREFFEGIPDYVSDENFRLIYTESGSEVIGGLLLFYGSETVEYFTPAYKIEERDKQPTSLLIFHAMRDAISRGYRFWNFGGTRDSQEGLYRFKRGWGAVDYDYTYFVAPHSELDQIRSASPEELSDAYPWFYVIPYEELL